MDPVSYISDAAAAAATLAVAPQDIRINALTDDAGNITTVQIVPPATAPKQHSLFICVLDVSGSMGSSAAGTSTADQQSPDALFSRLDLVKHSMNTLIQGVEDEDYVAIIRNHPIQWRCYSHSAGYEDDPGWQATRHLCSWPDASRWWH
jgi:hypothetical protein